MANLPKLKLKLPALSKHPLLGKRPEGVFGLDVKREAAVSTPAVFGLRERGAPAPELPALPKLPRIEALPGAVGAFPSEKPRQLGEFLREKAPPREPLHKVPLGYRAEETAPGVFASVPIATISQAPTEMGPDWKIAEYKTPTMWDWAKVIVNEVLTLPLEAAGKYIQYVQGEMGASVADRGLGDRYIRWLRERGEEGRKEMETSIVNKELFPGYGIYDLAGLAENLSYSIISMGAGAGVGLGVGAVTRHPALGWAAGTAASGYAAYNMTTYEIMQEVLEAKNEEMIRKRGSGLTVEEEEAYKKEFHGLAVKYGLYEAIPEAISNFAFAKILTVPLTKVVGKSIAARVTAKLAGMYGEEIGTETITQMGQMGIREDLGLPGGETRSWWEAEDWMKSLKEVAPQTFVITSIMGGAGGVAVNIDTAVKSLEKEIGKTHALYGQLRTQIKETLTEAKKRPEAGFVRLPEKGEPEVKKPTNLITIIEQEAESLKEIESELRGGLAIPKIGEEGYIRVTEHMPAYGEFYKREGHAPKSLNDWKQIAEAELEEGRSSIGLAEQYKKLKPEAEIPEEIDVNEMFKKIREDEGLARKIKATLVTQAEKKAFLKSLSKDIKNAIRESISKERGLTPADIQKIKKALIKEAMVPGIPVKKAIREVTRQIKPELTQFTRRMRDLIRGVREGRIVTKQEIKATQTELLGIIDRSGLELKDKAKFSRAVKNIQTREQLERQLPEIQERIERLAEASEIRTLKGQIKKVLDKTKVRMRAGKPVGKFTPIVQKVLDSAREAIKLNAVESEAKIMDNLDRYKEKTMPIEVAVQNRVLDMNSQGPTGLRELLATITEIRETGEMAKALKDFNIQEELDREKNYLIDVVTDYKGIAKGRQTTGREKKDFKTRAIQSLKSLGQNFILSWRGLMQVLDWHTRVDKKTLADRYSVLKQENKYKALQEDYVNDFNQMFADVYGLPTETTKDRVMLPLRINTQIGKLKEEVSLGTFKNTVGQEVKIKMTRDEMIKRHMEFQDETLYDSFREGNNYTDEIRDAIEAELTDQEKELAEKQMDLYRKQYGKINPIYRKMYGVDLPFNRFYSPIIREGYRIDLKDGFQTFLDEISIRKAVTSKSFITRIRNALPIARHGSLEALDRHITQTNYFLAWAEKIRELDSIFADPRVREVIKEEFGNSLLRQIMNTIEDLAYKRRIRGDIHGSVDWFRKKFTLGALMLKPALAAKQMVSTVAYLEKLNPVEFTVGIVDFWRSPIKNYHIMAKESTFIRTRGKAGEIERDIRAALKTDVYKRFSKLHNFWNMAMMNIRLGDKGAIVTGSWAMRRAGMKKGVNLTETIRGYEEFSAETQQSADISQLSAVQKGGTFSVLFTMFKSSQRQYLAKEVNAIKTLFQKGGTSPKNIAKVARILAIYHVLLPVLFQYIANFGGWDEDDRKEYLRAGLLGSLNGLFLFGDIIDGIVRTAMGLRRWPQEVPIATIGKDLEQAIKKIDLEDITAEDVKEALFELAEAGNSLGIPVQYAKNLPMGLKEMAEGDIYKGIGLLLGWSEYYLKREKKGLGLPALPTLPKLPSLPALPSLPSF